MKLHFWGKVEGDKVILPDYFERMICRAMKGHDLRISVTPTRSLRSNQSNAYYWAVLLPAVVDAMIEAGNDLDDSSESLEQVHEFMKSRFLKGSEFVDIEGNVHKSPPTTATLTQKEFSNFIEHIREFAAEFLNTELPEADPNFAR